MHSRIFGTIFRRELAALRREVEAYADDQTIWLKAPGVSNSAGNLVLHLTGNLQAFIGAELGGSGYRRDRDAEFARTGVPRAALITEIETTIAVVGPTLDALADADLARPFPSPIAGVALSMGDALVHLASHLAYHLGQIDYHRRILTRDGTTVGAIAVGDLRVLDSRPPAQP
jgi:hypothetical protein